MKAGLDTFFFQMFNEHLFLLLFAFSQGNCYLNKKSIAKNVFSNSI